LLIYRSYENSLKQAGFQTLFACTGGRCFGVPGNGGYLGRYIASNWDLGGNSLSGAGSVLVYRFIKT
jgi:hypothetical protein